MKRIKLTMLFITMTLLGFHTNTENNMYTKVNLSKLNNESINLTAVSPTPPDTNTDAAEIFGSEYRQVSINSINLLSDINTKSDYGVNQININPDSINNNSHNFLKYSFAN